MTVSRMDDTDVGDRVMKSNDTQGEEGEGFRLLLRICICMRGVMGGGGGFAHALLEFFDHFFFLAYGVVYFLPCFPLA